MKALAIAAALVMAASPVLTGSVRADESAAPAKAAAAKEKPARMVCLQHRDIDGWGMRKDGKMVVNDTFGRKYLLDLAGWCNDFDFSFGVAFHSPGHIQGMCLDRGDYVIPVGNSTAMPGGRCYITGIQPYTKEMQAEYKKSLADAKDHKAKSDTEQAAKKTD